MAEDRRWYVVLRITSGPSASPEDRHFPGPEIKVGTEVGAKGLVLPTGLGVAPLHCVISVYGPREVYVTPAGHNPVRIAPYATMSWTSLEPLSERVYLEEGNAIHLGPTGRRGVTLEYVKAESIDRYEAERLASEGAGIVSKERRPPESIPAQSRRPSVTELVGSGGEPSKEAVRIFTVLMVMSALCLLVAAWSYLERRSATELDQGEMQWADADFTWTPGQHAQRGFQRPLEEFVIGPNLDIALRDGHGLDLDRPETWDPRFFYEVEQEFKRLSQRRGFFRQLHQVREAFSHVVLTMRREQLPLVFAGIPIVESAYRAHPQSECCAKGWWQFMPEAGARFSDVPGLTGDFRVASCDLRGIPGTDNYTPDQKAPPPRACTEAKYVGVGGCLISSCATDFRTDLVLSTEAAVVALREAYRDPEIRNSGAAVQIAIASHHAGYDDERLYEREPKPRKPKNLLPTYLSWDRSRPDNVWPSHFYGDVMRCENAYDPVEGCQRYMMASTQRYTVRIVASFLGAVCFYGKYPQNDAAFLGWERIVEEPDYCDQIEIPSPSQIEDES